MGAEFTEAMVPLDHADGHAFASIAVGEGLGKAYYRGPYEGGAAFLRITQGKGLERSIRSLWQIVCDGVANAHCRSSEELMAGTTLPSIT